MDLLTLHNNAREASKGRIIDETLSMLKLRMLELNLLQLDYGLDTGGGKLRKYKSMRYAIKKNRMNSRPGLGNPDLKFTGAFWKAWRTDLRNHGVDIYSTDPKAEFLADKYMGIYGLTLESMQTLRAEALVIYLDRLRKELGLS